MESYLCVDILSIIAIYLNWPDPSDQCLVRQWNLQHTELRNILQIWKKHTVFRTYTIFLDGKKGDEHDKIPMNILRAHAIDFHNCIIHTCNGVPHRDEDEPSIIGETTGLEDACEWYKNGLRHRDGRLHGNGLLLPAIIRHDRGSSTGTWCWFSYGKLHRNEVDPKTKMPLPARISVYTGSGSVHLRSWWGNGEPLQFENAAYQWESSREPMLFEQRNPQPSSLSSSDKNNNNKRGCILL